MTMLRILRRESGLTAAQMAEILGISPELYKQYETGLADPPASILIDFSKIFNVTLDFLCGLTLEPRRRSPDTDLPHFLLKH